MTQYKLALQRAHRWETAYFKWLEQNIRWVCFWSIIWAVSVLLFANLLELVRSGRLT